MNTNETITLDTPLKRGETEITTVEVSRPNSGALRGVTLMALLNMDVIAIQTVLPRVTQPSISSVEAATLDPADLAQFGGVISSFLLTKADRAKYLPA
jgi:hypothetical protein